MTVRELTGQLIALKEQDSEVYAGDGYCFCIEEIVGVSVQEGGSVPCKGGKRGGKKK